MMLPSIDKLYSRVALPLENLNFLKEDSIIFYTQISFLIAFS